MRRSRITAALAMLVSLTGASTSVGAKAVPATRPAVAPASGADLPGPRNAITIDRPMAAEAGVSPDVLNLAINAVSCGVASGDLQAPPTLTLIDYSLPSTRPRLWVFDLHTGKMLFNELVAHGRNSGDNMAT